MKWELFLQRVCPLLELRPGDASRGVMGAERPLILQRCESLYRDPGLRHIWCDTCRQTPVLPQLQRQNVYYEMFAATLTAYGDSTQPFAYCLCHLVLFEIMRALSINTKISTLKGIP